MKFRTALLWLTAVAGIIGWLMVAAAWQHNPQGEFHQESRVNYGALATLFFFWFGGILACCSPLLYLWMWFRSRHPAE